MDYVPGKCEDWKSAVEKIDQNNLTFMDPFKILLSNVKAGGYFPFSNNPLVSKIGTVQFMP